jgi:hypothetical protein
MAQKDVIVRKRHDVEHDAMKAVLALMNTISYGSLTLFIQDGKVLQIDKKERMRLG